MKNMSWFFTISIILNMLVSPHAFASPPLPGGNIIASNKGNGVEIIVAAKQKQPE